jgi:glutamyl-tRNA synthetase
MPQLAVPVRLLVFGREQTPSVDAMLAQLPRQTVVTRLTEGAAVR